MEETPETLLNPQQENYSITVDDILHTSVEKQCQTKRETKPEQISNQQEDEIQQPKVLLPKIPSASNIREIITQNPPHTPPSMKPPLLDLTKLSLRPIQHSTTARIAKRAVAVDSNKKALGAQQLSLRHSDSLLDNPSRMPNGLVCPVHGRTSDNQCNCGYRKVCSYKFSVDTKRNSKPRYTVCSLRNGIQKLSDANEDEKVAHGAGTQKEHRKKKVTITLRELTSFCSEEVTGSNQNLGFISPNRKPRKERPLGLIQSVHLSLVPSYSLPSLTTSSEMTAAQNQQEATIQTKSQYDLNKKKKVRLNYCDREKTNIIMRWLQDVEKNS